MPFNGGTPNVFQRVYSWVTDKTNGIPVTASRVDTEDDGFATGLSLALLRDGSQQVSANMPWNGYHITGYGSTSAASARTDVPAWGQIQDGAANYAVFAGSADGLTLTPSPAITAYAAGQIFWGRLTATNVTATPTISVSGLTAKTIKKRGGTTGQALVAGDLTSGNIAAFAYQSATDVFELVSPAIEIGLGANTWTGLQNFAAAGISFGHETMTDYDEGTWTATVTCGTSGTVTLSANTGKFIRVGNLVSVWGEFGVGSVSSPSGTAILGGLPFTIANTDTAAGGGGAFAQTWTAALTTSIGFKLNKNTTGMFIYSVAATGGMTAVGVADKIQGTATIAIALTYSIV